MKALRPLLLLALVPLACRAAAAPEPASAPFDEAEFDASAYAPPSSGRALRIAPDLDGEVRGVRAIDGPCQRTS